MNEYTPKPDLPEPKPEVVVDNEAVLTRAIGEKVINGLSINAIPQRRISIPKHVRDSRNKAFLEAIELTRRRFTA